MVKRGESIQPRPEAEPLAFADLTAEQRDAGKRASELLRGMARAHRGRAGTSARVHSYLPVIDDSRSNRVVLLDGARGSGKSALLLSLLNAYNQALVEQQVPPGYEEWVSPADRVVPVGLIDLQPLPSSTHLLFHLVASLEHVVEAMEEHHDSPRLGAAAWHPGGGDELPSRKRWRDFARVAASGWESNLAERKGRLDPEAFAVEVEQGELQRLSMIPAFRAFVDALVEDYRGWIRWQSAPPPLFVLAIDDADLNPALSAELLELMRKLWHPQLAFLLTGDTDLFLATLSRSRERQLGLDLYSKIIPQLHRCKLSVLPPAQRLEAGPGLRRIFQRFVVPVEGGSIERSLADYFVLDPQTQEALPGRLRHLWELSAWLQLPGWDSQPPAVTSLHDAVMRLWQWVIREALIPNSLREQLEPMVRIDAETGVLKLESFISMEAQVEFVREVHVADHARLTFERPVRIRAFDAREEKEPLEDQVTAALMLVTDFLADASGGVHFSPSAIPSGLSTPLFAHAVLEDEIEKSPQVHAWPVPAWRGFLDLALLRKEWEVGLSAVAPHEPDGAVRAARLFLKAVLRVGGQGVNDVLPVSEASDSWEAIAAELARIVRERLPDTQRHRILRDWALGRAGLLATPESGLPAEAANAFLGALIEAFDDDATRLRHALSEARRKRLLQRSSRETDAFRQTAMFRHNVSALSSSAVEEVIQKLDTRFPAYDFGRRVEGAAEEEPKDHVQHFERLMGLLKRIRLTSLDSILGVGKRTLSLFHYLSLPRQEWLRQAPTPLLLRSHQALEPFSQMRDAGAPALVELWKAACASAGKKEWGADVQSTQEGLRIEESLRNRLDAARVPEAEGGESLSFEPSEGPGSRVYGLQGVLRPILTGARQPHADRALEAILRMAYDHGEDLEGAGSAPERFWRGSSVLLKGRAFHLWPVPAWSTLYEWECVEACWTEAIRLARNAAGNASVQQHTRILDALAFLLMESCTLLESREENPVNLELRLQAEHWTALIRRNVRTRPRGNKSRMGAYKAWRKWLPLLAAPESGLSTIAAAGVLSGLRNATKREQEVRRMKFMRGVGAGDPEASKILNDGLNDAFSTPRSKESEEAGEPSIPQVGRAELAGLAEPLNLLRRERLVAAGVPPGEVDALLLEVDERHPEHPWVKRFGRWPGATAPSRPE